MTLELGYTTDDKPPFKYAAHTRVGFSDTDAQGIVYYGRYVPYFDLARVEYHRHLELAPERLEGNEFVMRAMSIEYHAPAVFDDLIEVFVRLARIGRTSATYEFAAYRADDDELMVTASQTLVLVDLEERKACAIPQSFIEAVRAFEGDDLQVGFARMIGDHQRNGALEAIDRIVNRGGDDVVTEALAVLSRIYGSVELGDDGTISAENATEDDEALLARVALLLSAYVSSAEDA